MPKVPAALALDRGHARIKLGPAAISISGTVLLIGFDRRHVAAVSRGENSGRTLAHVDVVRGIEQVTQFDSRTSTIAAAVRWQCDRVAAIVQARDGAILGVAISDANPL
jgi:hypothetical protein